MWVHSNPLMSHASVTFISPPVVTPPPVAKSVSFTGYITMQFLKLLLCCDVALSSPIMCVCGGGGVHGSTCTLYCVSGGGGGGCTVLHVYCVI